MVGVPTTAASPSAAAYDEGVAVRSIFRPLAVGATALALVLAGGVVAAPAQAVPANRVLINEVYGAGGNSGAALNQDYVELYNPNDVAVDLSGWAIQYASATGTFNNRTVLSGSIPAGGYFLYGGASGSNGGAIPAPDVTGALNLSGTNGKVALTDDSVAPTSPTDANVSDYVGFGTATAFRGSGPAPAPSTTTSISRDADHLDTADNAADFAAGAPSPANTSGAPEEPEEPEPPVTLTIAEIQGTGTASAHQGATVTTTGVVTAHYPTGGFNGYVIQTPGPDTTPGASDALFVFSSVTVGSVALGDEVTVTGVVSEFNGLTEITVPAGGAVLTGGAPPAVEPYSGAWPATDAEREALESMLYLPTGEFTVSNTFNTNSFGEVGLASGDRPLIQPTEVGAPGSAEAGAQAADNAARAVALDDGASTNFLSTANTGLTPTYVSLTDPVRVGAEVAFSAPVVVDFRNNAWKLNPTSPGRGPVTFENTRTATPDPVGGDFSVASFNVLNYFTTLGEDVAGCEAFTDRTGDPVTVDECPGTGPRGAFEDEDLERQQAKIVAAITALDADVVGLLEIENSAVVDGVADEALATLVDALNEAAGSPRWAYVPSSPELPDPSLQDVITNALIYQPAAVSLVGQAKALGTESDEPSGAFQNAREPIGATFAPVGGGESVFVAVNHFKSKGSAGPWPGDVDAGDGQGASNESRVRQAEALAAWVPQAAAGVEAVALVGDFNSYTREDPLQVLYDAGYTDAAADLAPGQYSYSFSGLYGSLDHVLLNAAARERATGADVWEINAEESIALEYSRYNYHGTLFYAPDVYRSSDHDPVVVGLERGEVAPTVPAWNARTIYHRGDEVLYKDKVWVAQWWTKNQKPGASAWGPWAEVGAEVVVEGKTYRQWTSSWIYERGDAVVHEGYVWKAKWWTRNQEPGASKWGPWTRVKPAS